MFKNPRFATAVLNVYIIAFIVVLEINVSHRLEDIMLFIAPIVSIWMFYTVIYSTDFMLLPKKSLYSEEH